MRGWPEKPIQIRPTGLTGLEVLPYNK